MKKTIFDLVQKTIDQKIDFTVEIADNSQFGHYATNIALRLAGILKTTPIDLARRLAEKIKNEDEKEFFDRVEVAPPGFINFWISKKVLQTQLQEILAEKKKYGTNKIGKGESVQVEFVSANPTGPLTLANGRGGFLGDAISSTLAFSSYKVEREYYVNDTGGQILTLGKSILAKRGLIEGNEDFYKGGYIDVWAEKNFTLVKKNINNPLKLGELAAKDFLSDIKKMLKTKAGIKFDRWTSEKNHIYKKNLPEKAEAIFKKKNLTYKNGGAVWFKTSDFGDDKDRVLITKDGFPTYFLADAGHYLETKKRGFKKKINILGPDHYGYKARVQAVAETVGLKNSEIIITQTIRIVKGDAKIKMSKRKGEFMTFEELLDAVKPDVARFFLLMYAPETHMDFDLELAKEESLKNPVYYVQYGYVRASNIIAKAKTKISDKTDLNALKNEPELNLILKLIQFPDIVEQIAEDYRVNRLTRYAIELAKAFHNFYEKERVIVKDEKILAARLALVCAVKIVLGNALDLMGISKPDKM